MVSLKDISKACGVSIATVSKALNGHNDISQKTKDMVCRKAKEMGYFPNSAAKALKTNRSQNIGVLFADAALSGLTHDYFAHVLDSFKREAEDHGYDITFINCSKNQKNPMSYLDHARYRGFDGIVIACIDFTDPDVIELMQSNIPVATVDYVFNNCMSVSSDNAQGIRELVEYAYERGHRKIAFIHGEEAAVTKERVSSFYLTTQCLGIQVPQEYMKVVPYRDCDGTAQATRELMQLKNPPTCILCPDDYAAFGAVSALEEMKLKVGTDISIAGYDGVPVGRYMNPQLTTVHQDTEQLGSLAAKKLIALIEQPNITLIEHIRIGTDLVKGGTIAEL